MCKEMVHEVIAQNNIICKEHSQSNCVYIIKSGTVGIYINNQCVKRLHSGDHFGMIGIIRKINRTSSAIAEEKSELFSIGVEAFEKMFKKNFITSLLELYIVYIFKKSKFLNQISTVRLREITPNFEQKFYKTDEVIYKEGEDILNRMLIIIEGNIKDVILIITPLTLTLIFTLTLTFIL